jgi:CubicO group peptidase (beta-lactamase class C family)
MMIRVILIFIIYLAIFVWSSKAVFSQTGSNKSGTNQVQKVIDRKELEPFLDKLFAEQMPKYNIPGAVFTLVKDGKIIFSKGYGYADLEKKKNVNPDRTLLRAYSISKSFTATAVMQLVERGQLKLDEDVNIYLKRFKIKDSFAEPVTLADLLTHNAGYTDPELRKQLAQGEFRELDLGKYLEKNLPSRSRPPGTFEYSNFGAALAGFIVEEVSGEAFHSYVEKHIFKPLGMNHSTFLLPSQLPQKRLADFAYSYTVENGVNRKMPFEIADFSTSPAANLLTTGTDLAKYMIAHLQNGRYENIRILSEALAKQMHEPWLFSNSRPDFGYGFFWRAEDDGQRVLFHAGGYGYGNVNIMQLVPEYNAAFFLSFTHGGNLEKRNMRNVIGSQLMNCFLTNN